MSKADRLAADLDRLLDAVRAGELEASDRLQAFLAGAASAAHELSTGSM